MIHIKTARKIMESGQPFDCLAWKMSTGEVMNYTNVVCTSSNFERNTVNLKFINSGEVRTVRVITIFEINNEQVYI